MLVVALTAMRGAREALAMTSPALLLSNAHRAWMFRRTIDRKVASAFAMGAIPGALVGGLAVPSIPPRALSVLLVVSTISALARSRGLFQLRARASTIAPAGTVIGALAATSGGAGMLVGPLYLSLGLSGAAYVGTVAISGVALHIGRVIGYGAVGLLSASLVPDALTLLAGLVAGNAVARRLRTRFTSESEARIELASLTLATVLAVFGVAR